MLTSDSLLCIDSGKQMSRHSHRGTAHKIELGNVESDTQTPFQGCKTAE